jgi:hypothetical protein
MAAQNDTRAAGPAARRASAIWLWLSILAALLAALGSVIALSVGRIYASLTPAFFPQALAQDTANLALVAPAWLLLAALALRGSLRAYLLWLGVLTFTVYNYVIYTFSVPFGALFPLWVAVFGLCIYALIGGIATADQTAIRDADTNRRAASVAAWSIIIVAILFGFLWLSEDVPALLSGTTPQSLVDMALPTNPVHILDLAFFLPAGIAVGILLLKGKPLAYTLAPAFMVFVILTGIPILLTPIIQAARGDPAGWAVVPPIGTLTLIQFGLLAWLISTIRPHTPPA